MKVLQCTKEDIWDVGVEISETSKTALSLSLYYYYYFVFIG